MTLDEATRLFTEDGRVRKLSPDTLESYQLFLNRFADWCTVHHIDDVREVKLSHVLDFRAGLDRKLGRSKEPLSVGYRNSHVRAVRLLFRLLYKRGHLLTNLAAQIPPMTDPMRLPRGILNRDQVQRLLQSTYMTTPTGFRDRSIFELLYSTGLRGGELCRLTLYDLDLSERTLRVLCGKGRKDRVVPIGKVACSYLCEYIKSVRPVLLGDKSSSVVFVTAKGKAFHTRSLWKQFIVHRNRAGLPDTICVHSLRHTCATEMLKGGASIRHVQELLGHADISTTQMYTHVVQSDLKKAHARTAPSERRKRAQVPVFDPEAPAWNDKKNAPLWPKVHGGKQKKNSRKR